VAAAATRAVSGPVDLARNDGRLVLEPAQLAELLTVRQREEEPRLVLDLDPDGLHDAIGEDVIAAFEVDPVDAEIALVDGAIQISESSDGFRFDAGIAAEQVLALATGAGERSATLDGRILEPELSTAEAHDLGIVEPTGTFTTHFTAGQSRVQNIARISELVSGVVLRPGASFSVNDHVGPRTEEKGFVPGGAILEGEFVEQIGGGVSQFATTLYNAAYFGGYELVRYQAHSYYISRYPMGREATLNYPTIDLEIRNNSPHGLLIEATTTASSVTVTTWGTPWVEVESVTGQPFNVRSGRVRNGFDVVDTRVLRFPDGREEREERFTRYLPED
jgi:vancomycin resistance protein YoaR